MAGWRVIIMALLMLILTGCAHSQGDGTPVPPNSQYDQFVRIIQNENLEEKGIDLESLAAKYAYRPLKEIEGLSCALEWCNLSKESEDYHGDLVARIDIRNDVIDEKTLICAFVADENSQYWNVLTEKFEIMNLYDKEPVEYEVINILGGEKRQIKLTTKRTADDHTIENMQILAYSQEQSKMSIIFNELIASDAFFPFREGEEKGGPRILCLNEYQFIPVPVGGCDILLNTRIVKDENKAGLSDESPNQNEILAEGLTRFIFNGKCFVPDGVYYDYRYQAQRICDGR
jgi:hypothetical protein